MWSAIVLPSNKSWFGKGRKSVQFKKKFTNKGTWGKTWFWPLFDYLIYDMVFLRNTILIMNNRDVPGRRHLGKADVCVCADFKELGKYVSRLAMARHLVVRAAWNWDSLCLFHCLGWFGFNRSYWTLLNRFPFWMRLHFLISSCRLAIDVFQISSKYDYDRYCN